MERLKQFIQKNKFMLLIAICTIFILILPNLHENIVIGDDYLYHLADDMQRIGCDRHFSDNDLVRFIRKIGVKDPTIITIHGSNRLSADSYTRKFIQGRLPASKVAVSVGGKNGVKNIFKL